MVMCREPVMRTPARGFSAAYLRRMDIRPGISCSAIEISLRPQSARLRSATLKAGAAAVRSIVAGVMCFKPHIDTSEYIDTIVPRSHGVNRKIAAHPGGHKSPAHRVASGAGGALRGRTARNPGHGTEHHLDSPGAVEACRISRGPPHRQEHLVPLQTGVWSVRAAHPLAAGYGGDSGRKARPGGPGAYSAQTAGQDPCFFR